MPACQIEVPVVDSCADSMESGLFGEPAITPVVVTDDERKQVEELLRNLRDSSPESATDQALNQYTHTRFPELRQALKELTVKSKDKTIDVTFRSRITAMVSTLNLYLDPDLSYTWRQSSALAAKAAGKNAISYGRSIRNWLHTYLHRKKLPLHNHGGGKSSILDDEDIRSQVQLHMMEAAKKGHITAQDLVDFIASREMQEKLPDKLSISERTAQRWLNKMNFRYARKPNGMYIDGHERPDVVEYRNKFVKRWQRHELRMLVYDENGKECRKPVGYKLDNPGQPFRLELITHDESTFYANDRSRQRWFHTSEAATPVRKGEGASIMVSDFLTPTFGRLIDGDEEARVLFRAGKNRDGYFTAEDLIAQVDKAIDIFEGKTNGFVTGLWLFDNAPSHQKRAPDALSARYMPKGPSETWQPKPGVRMRPGKFADGSAQDFYFPDDHPTMGGWFKGMEEIIRERGLWPENGSLNAQCPGFKCEAGRSDCCCRRLLFTQPDFVGQKSHLQEFIESRGHLCDFYPKFHPETNFIEQYWGLAKYFYRISPKTTDIDEMEANVKACLDKVSLLQIRRYVLKVVNT